MTFRQVYTIDNFLSEVCGGAMCRSRFYELVSSGEIRTHKMGARTIVTGADAQKFIEGLPAVVPKAA